MSSDRPDFAHRATRKIVGIIIGVLIFIPIVLFGFGEAVLHLWNWLMPMLFHLPVISFWEGVGLMCLGWLLFGGLRGLSGARAGYRGHGHCRMPERWEQRWDDRWNRMSPEERDKFREWARARCGQVAADTQSKA